MKINKITISLICTGILFCITNISQADQIADMKKELDRRVGLIKKYNERNAKNLIEPAQKEVFRKYFTATTANKKKKLKAEIDEVSLVVQAKTKVDEMCLIDKKGQEISRIVFQEVAPDSDLSAEEASAPFFNPSFSKKKQEAHIEKPYMSADSLRWVICYATPIVLKDGTKPGIYHYEMPLYSLQKKVNRDLKKNSDKYFILVNKDGYIMSDSRKRFNLFLDKSDKEMKAPKSDYFPSLKEGSLGSIAKKIMSESEGSESFKDNDKEFVIVHGPAGYFGWKAALVQIKK